jgi:hypothetical protein
MKALQRDLEDSVLVEASTHWRLSRVETRALASAAKRYGRFIGFKPTYCEIKTYRSP